MEWKMHSVRNCIHSFSFISIFICMVWYSVIIMKRLWVNERNYFYFCISNGAGMEESLIPKIKRNKHTNLMFYDART